METSVWMDRPLLAFASALHLRGASFQILHLVNLLVLFAIVSIWVLPCSYAIGFAVKSRFFLRWQWGFCIVATLIAAFLFVREKSYAPISPRGAALAALLLLVWEGIAAARKLLGIRKLLLMQAASILILFLPSASAILLAPTLPPEAQMVWSVVLQAGTWQAMNTGSEFEATRRMVFVGDRIVLAFDAGSASYQGTQPMSQYKVLSLDRASGTVKNQLDFTGSWGSAPLLFATSEEHVVLDSGKLELFNADLVSTGKTLGLGRGRVSNASPDGTTLGWEASPGTILIDANTFAVVKQVTESAPTAVSRRAVLTNDTSYPKDFPKENAFITRTDEKGSRLIYHVPCGTRPEFLSEDRILSIGCGEFSILDYDGHVLSEKKNAGRGFLFAGVSRDGSRFALQASEEEGDQAVLIYEEFFIYSAQTGASVATVSVSDMPERQSWSAFSPDGRYFAVGNPNRLTLYALP